jgi:hypothetical protein
LSAENKSHVIPLEAFLDDNMGPNLSGGCDPRPVLHGADIIFGVDIMSGHEFIVFGRDVLEEIARSGQSRRLRVLYIGIDQETEELEKLLAMVQVVKGRDDYQASEPDMTES